MAHEEFRPKDLNGAIAHLIEECGEVLAAAGKSVRFGLDSVNPLIPENERETNAAWLWREMDDLEKAITALKAMVSPAGTSISPAMLHTLRKIGTGTVSYWGGSQEAGYADALWELGLVKLIQAERSPFGQRWYSLTASGLHYIGLEIEAA